MASTDVVVKPPYGDPELGLAASELPGQTDVVVIGGGIVGAACAYRLGTRGLQITLVEKGKIASEQSGRNWGFVRQQGRDPAELPLMMASNTIWKRLSADLGADVEWTEGGSLALTDDEALAERHGRWAQIAAEHGLDTRVVDMAEIRRLMPGVNGSWLAGLYTPSDGHANPVQATAALARAAAKAGAKIVTECAVDAIEVAGGKVIGVRTRLGIVRCQTVVLAAGIWSSRLAATVGVNIPQGIVKNSVAATQVLPHLSKAAVWTRDLAFRQLPSGRVIISGGAVTEVNVYINSIRHARLFLPVYLRNRETFKLKFGSIGSLVQRPSMRSYRLAQPKPNMRYLTEAMRAFRRYFPALASARIEHAWAGHIDGTPDELPIIEALERPAGLILATGFSGHGFAMGPVAGTVVEGLILDGRTPFDLRPMRLGRFSDGSARQPDTLL